MIYKLTFEAMAKRNLKFRAWDKESQRFIKAKDIENSRIPVRSTRNGFELMSKFIIQQWTGIKDRRGIEIYEGDTLAWRYKGDAHPFTGTVIYGHHMVGRDSWGLELPTVGFFIQFDDGGICGIDLKDKYIITGHINKRAGKNLS
jgi:hypothetical protein